MGQIKGNRAPSLFVTMAFFIRVYPNPEVNQLQKLGSIMVRLTILFALANVPITAKYLGQAAEVPEGGKRD